MPCTVPNITALPSPSSSNASFKTPIAGILVLASAATTSITFPLNVPVGSACTTVPFAKVAPCTFLTSTSNLFAESATKSIQFVPVPVDDNT